MSKNFPTIEIRRNPTLSMINPFHHCGSVDLHLSEKHDQKPYFRFNDIENAWWTKVIIAENFIGKI